MLNWKSRTPKTHRGKAWKTTPRTPQKRTRKANGGASETTAEVATVSGESDGVADSEPHGQQNRKEYDYPVDP